MRQFGGLTAVDVAHVEIQRGAITALIGPNGAGKTTFFNLLTGFDQPDQGSWSFGGRSLKGVAAHKVARMGMVRTFQLTKALGGMTVLENMRLGATGQGGENFFSALIRPLWRKKEDEITERARGLLKKFKLDAKEEDYADSLSGGQRKLLEMARALMTKPDLVMLDEPMAGLGHEDIAPVMEIIRSLAKGRTILMVEHNMKVIAELCDRVTVLQSGQILAEGSYDEVSRDPAVIEAYVGGAND